MMRARDVAERLATLPPVELPAVGVLLRLRADELAGRGTDVAALVEAQPDLERLVAALMTHVAGVNEVNKRCLAIPPQPGHLPPGF